jgi:hypothetical protein
MYDDYTIPTHILSKKNWKKFFEIIVNVGNEWKTSDREKSCVDLP